MSGAILASLTCLDPGVDCGLGVPDLFPSMKKAWPDLLASPVGQGFAANAEHRRELIGRYKVLGVDSIRLRFRIHCSGFVWGLKLLKVEAAGVESGCKISPIPFLSTMTRCRAGPCGAINLTSDS